MEDAQFFISMNLAIKNAAASKIDVKAELKKELAAALDDLQLDYSTEYTRWFQEEVGQNYAEARALLQ